MGEDTSIDIESVLRKIENVLMTKDENKLNTLHNFFRNDDANLYLDNKVFEGVNIAIQNTDVLENGDVRIDVKFTFNYNTQKNEQYVSTKGYKFAYLIVSKDEMGVFVKETNLFREIKQTNDVAIQLIKIGAVILSIVLLLILFKFRIIGKIFGE